MVFLPQTAKFNQFFLAKQSIFKKKIQLLNMTLNKNLIETVTKIYLSFTYKIRESVFNGYNVMADLNLYQWF